MLKTLLILLFVLLTILNAEYYNNKNTISVLPGIIHSTNTTTPDINKFLYVRYGLLTDTIANLEIGGYINTNLDNDHAVGFTYRKYPFSSGDHFFWGTKLGYRYCHYTSTLDSTVLFPQYFNNITTVNYLQSGAEIGWRWNWQCGLAIETSLLINLDIGISDGDKVKNEFRFDQTQYLPAVCIGYMF